jgi:hypothetical protein
MKKTRNAGKALMWALAAWAVVAWGIAGGAGAEGYPSAKAACQVANITLIDGSTQTDWTTLLCNRIKTANQKDLFVDVSFECGLYTQTLVRSKGGVKDTSTAEAIVKVRVLVDGEPAFPGDVVFSRRMQELSATLQGIINDDALILVDTDGDGIPDAVQIDEDLLTPEEIELILDTMTANSFNFVLNDLSSGVHTIEVQAKIDTATSAQEGTASATATIGKGSVTVEEVRLIKDDDIVLD